MILLPLMFQVGSTPSALSPNEQRYRACIALATSDPKAAEAEADRFRSAGGGARAHQCQGMAYTQEARWGDAATAFEAAARDADTAHDPEAARYWAQAGNAWLAAGDAVKAQTALTTAITAGTLDNFGRGEALLDRARAQVAAGRLVSARGDIDAAQEATPKDPLAWLLSATLARRMNDLPRAQTDIAEALKLSSDDASVQLEEAISPLCRAMPMARGRRGRPRPSSHLALRSRTMPAPRWRSSMRRLLRRQPPPQ